jgi:hypothetical protein
MDKRNEANLSYQALEDYFNPYKDFSNLQTRLD